MMNDCISCVCCGEEHGLEDVRNIVIKGKNKKICKQCIATIKGLS